AETTGESAVTTAYSVPEGTTSELENTGGLDPYLVTLRLEGRKGVRFGGSCDFEGRRRTVEGQVPGRFVIDTEGSELSCRIGKTGQMAGQLRVVLTSDGQTRSVQQTGSGGEVSVSYNPPTQGG
ncbi:MAG: hypothetical protein ACR2KW_02420, partial [Rubrobacter sp.]